MERRRASLFTTDQRMVWALSPVLGKLGFSCDTHGDHEKLLCALRRLRTDLVVIDCPDGHAGEVIRDIRAASPRPLTLMVLANRRLAAAVHAAGADLVCDRGLNPKEVMDTLLKARALVTGDKRVLPRTNVQPLTYLRYSFDGVQFCQAVIVDLSSGGVCIEALEGLQAGRAVHVSFSLPAMRTPITAVGEIMWRDHAGRAGIRFTHIAEASVRQIERWLEAASRPFGSTLGLVPAKRAATAGSW